MKKSKSKLNHSKPISTYALSELADRLFDPNLKPPRVINPPRPPSLAGSKLSPPLAEVDERPAWRVRRFRLWTDNAPSLYLAVLDPRRRGHLRRYQSFALPNVATWLKGVQSIPVELRPIPDISKPTPYKPLIMPRTPYPHNPTAKIPKWEKNARWQRLLQFKYALDQEHERRFRRGMGELIDQVLEFEWDNLVDYECWETSPWRKKVDISAAIRMTQLFKDIRKKSINIYHHLSEAEIPIYPVPRREELHRAVKAESKRREDKRLRKEARQTARETAAQQTPNLAITSGSTDIREDTVSHQSIDTMDEAERKRLGLDVLDAMEHGLPLAGELAELEAIRYQIRQLRVGGPLIRAPRDMASSNLSPKLSETAQYLITSDPEDEVDHTDGQVILEREEEDSLTDTSTVSSDTLQTPTDNNLPSPLATLTGPTLRSSRKMKNKDVEIMHLNEETETLPHMSYRTTTSPIPGETFSSNNHDKALSDYTPRRLPRSSSIHLNPKKPEEKDNFSRQDLTGVINSLYPKDDGQRIAERFLRNIANSSFSPPTTTSNSHSQSGKEAEKKRVVTQTKEGGGESSTTERSAKIPQRQLFIIRKPDGMDDKALLEISPKLYSQASQAKEEARHLRPPHSGSSTGNRNVPAGEIKLGKTNDADKEKKHSQSSRKRDRRKSGKQSRFPHSTVTSDLSTVPNHNVTDFSPVAPPPRTLLPSSGAISVSPTSLLHHSTDDSTRRAPSVQSFVYGDLNKDEDTRRPFTSSAPPRSEISSALSWSSGHDESNSSNGSLGTEYGVEYAGFAGFSYEGDTMGTAVDTEPDTLGTARPARTPRRVLMGS